MADSIPTLVQEIQALCHGGTPIRLMEVCGTHTVSLFRSGVRSLLPPNLRLISGPGCPVCVTSQGYLDAALEIGRQSQVVLCTYGDMVRVPGRLGSLENLRSQGGEVLVVYSPRDAVRYAQLNPGKKLVFLAVGFETTTPGTAAAILEAEQLGLTNFFIISGHKLVIPAMMALLSGGQVGVDGFICPGHVSIVLGADSYRPIVEKYHKPCVVTGFEPAQMLKGILHLARQVKTGQATVENVYGVAVDNQGNKTAQEIIHKVFTSGDAVWRAIGTIPESGLHLRPEFRRFDALEHFNVLEGPDVEPPGCRCGQVIQGLADPGDCPLFGTGCTPLKPVGPCMVSSEGTCAAWYKYKGH